MANKQVRYFTEQDILVIRLYSSAKSWNKTSQLMSEAVKIDRELGISFNVVLTLAIELSLKTILAMSGHCESCLIESKHSLSELFKKLGEHNLNAIANTFTSAYKNSTGEEIDFMKLVKEHDRSFIEWRYLNFVKDLDNIVDTFDLRFMVNLQNTVASIMETIHRLYMVRINSDAQHKDNSESKKK